MTKTIFFLFLFVEIEASEWQEQVFKQQTFCHIVLFNNNHVSLGTGNCNLLTAEVCDYALAAGRKGFIGISPVVFDLSLHEWIASV